MANQSCTSASATTTTIQRKRKLDEFVYYNDDGDNNHLIHQQLTKYTCIELDSNTSDDANTIPLYVCPITQCTIQFNSFSELEQHYYNAHVHTCHICKLVLTNSRLLECHILEFHDTSFYILSKSIKLYCCIFNTCNKKFSSRHKRQLHCIAKHNVSDEYMYDEIIYNKRHNKTIHYIVDKMNTSHQHSSTIDNTACTNSNTDELIQQMSQIKLIPRQVVRTHK